MKRAYRKRSYPLDEIRRFLEPGPIVLVSSAWQGSFDIMTMGWHMMLGFSPALFGCYIWEENHSYHMLRRSKECVIDLQRSTSLTRWSASAIATVQTSINSSGLA
jgi:flavin reductase (DIM6/NTAB) family NADH-FMN oxidoreductase RutF